MKLQDARADVLIIGAGLAGMMAAWSAQREGARVLLLDRNSLGMGTNSALSNAVLAGPTSTYTADQYVQDTLEIGREINRKPWVVRVAREAPGAIEQLLSFGLEAREGRDSFAVQSPAPEAIPGVTLVRTVAAQVKGREPLRIKTGFYVSELLVDGGRAIGLSGLDEEGREVRIFAPAIILAAGGAGAVYLRNDNQKSTLGQGYALAARAGLSLWDMEFVQFFPLVLAEPRLPALILYPPFPREVKLIDAEGKDISSIHGASHLMEAIMERRDAFSAALYERLKATGPVYLDYRTVPAAWWDRNPMKGMTKLKFDFRNTPVSIAPAAHFFMGGVRIDHEGRTDLPGLYACGEMIWGLHGANRRGGNALTECLVSGLLAGRQAAADSRTRPTPPAPEIRQPNRGSESVLGSIREEQKRLREIAWENAGVVRTGPGMQEGLLQLREMESRIDGLTPSDPGETRGLGDLKSALLVVQAVLTAGLNRAESRGSFIRKEHPQEDNRQWLKNSCLDYLAGEKRFDIHYPQVEI